MKPLYVCYSGDTFVCAYFKKAAAYSHKSDSDEITHVDKHVAFADRDERERF